MDEMRADAKKRSGAKPKTKSSPNSDSGSSAKSREGKRRVDIYLSDAEFSRLALFGASAVPYCRPNKYAEKLVLDALSRSK